MPSGAELVAVGFLALCVGVGVGWHIARKGQWQQVWGYFVAVATLQGAALLAAGGTVFSDCRLAQGNEENPEVGEAVPELRGDPEACEAVPWVVAAEAGVVGVVLGGGITSELISAQRRREDDPTTER
jgi:hypothetical protein